MQHLIAKIGKGQRGAKDLTWDEAKEAIGLLIEGQASQVQIGAFLMAMRVKTESVAELAAFTAMARQYVSPLMVPSDFAPVDLPLYGEKHETFHVSIAAAIVASSQGAPILIHSVENKSTASDATRVLTHLGIPTELHHQDVTEYFQENRFAYLDMALYHPTLARFLDLRKELGVQSLFHQVARMLNPTRARSQVIGIAHPPYLEKMVEAVTMLGCEQVLIFPGVEGHPELSMTTGTVMRESRAGTIFPVNLKPRDVGLAFGSFRDMSLPTSTLTTAVPQQEATLLRNILDNQVRGSQRDWVVYNAAMLLYAGGKAPSIAAGVPIAQRAIASGAAAKKLTELSAPNPSRQASRPATEEVHT